MCAQRNVGVSHGCSSLGHTSSTLCRSAAVICGERRAAKCGAHAGAKTSPGASVFRERQAAAPCSPSSLRTRPCAPAVHASANKRPLSNACASMRNHAIGTSTSSRRGRGEQELDLAWTWVPVHGSGLGTASWSRSWSRTPRCSARTVPPEQREVVVYLLSTRPFGPSSRLCPSKF